MNYIIKCFSIIMLRKCQFDSFKNSNILAIFGVFLFVCLCFFGFTEDTPSICNVPLGKCATNDPKKQLNV